MINITKKIILQALDSASQPLLIADAGKSSHPVAYANAAFEVLVGYGSGELVGRPLKKLVVNGELPKDGRGASSDARDGGSRRYNQTWRLQQGGSRSLTLDVAPLYDRPGKPAYWLFSLVAGGDIVAEADATSDDLQSALDDTRLQLRRLERSDPATGLPNQTAFIEVLQRDWAIARREQRRIGAIVFRVDAFDAYLDLFGRHATDSCLRKVAHAISGSLRRDGDLAARFDVDQFAVLIGSANEEQAIQLAEIIEKKVRTLAIQHPRSKIARHVTVSFGISTDIPAWSEPAVTLLERAEEDLLAREQAAEQARSDAASA